MTSRNEATFDVSSVGDSEAPKSFEREIRREVVWWKEGLHCVEGNSYNTMICLVTSFPFTVGC